MRNRKIDIKTKRQRDWEKERKKIEGEKSEDENLFIRTECRESEWIDCGWPLIIII